MRSSISAAARARGRRVGVAFAIAVVAALVVVSVGAGANKPTAVAGVDSFTPAVQPLGVSHGAVTVVVETAGDPVAVQQADAGQKLTKDQKKAAAAALKAQQKPVENAAKGVGATVLGDYQYAYSGFKVRVARNKLDDLAALPGVVAVRHLQLMKPDNAVSVPYIGAPLVWDGLNGLHGEGVKIAVIDTGIDYTNANFGGLGTTAAYDAAHATSTLPADATMFGPAAPKVKGGVDLVGDDYNADPTSADYQPVPHPDSNPLDCAGHGSHVSGTAAGFGILSNGSTYTGPYNASTVSSHTWTVGPGVAPKADLYAVRVFGCEGSTDVTVDAIEWAVANDMDVINMSLGSPFGSSDDPSAVASSNAAKAGVIVVTSAGNSGPNPYIVGSPSTGDGSISVAAVDSTESFPGVNIAANGGDIPAINANGISADGITAPIKVLKTGTGAISLGCDPAEYTAAGVAGKIVVTKRGTCARVARAIFGQKAGAVAVIMVNSDNTYPPFEGQITSNPDTGEPYTVTIPFLGVKLSSGTALSAADGMTAALTNAPLANPAFRAFASFSSGGPRNGDSFLKPDISAPGVSIASTAVGTGNGVAVMSGTSMASPHVAGVAALVRQAHPTWKKVSDLKAAIVNTANAAKVAGFSVRVGGAGLVQPLPATQTLVVATTEKEGVTLNYGFEEVKKDFSKEQHIKLHNFGSTDATFTIAQAMPQGLVHTISAPSSVTVKAGEDADVQVRLNVPLSSIHRSSDVYFEDVSGLVTLTPAAGSNASVSLAVPYYFVPSAQSQIDAKLEPGNLKNGTGTLTLRNAKDAARGTADGYVWGLSDKKGPGKTMDKSPADLRAVGVQSFPFSAGVQFINFAVNTYNRWSTPATQELDVYVDVNGDGTPDYDVVGIDRGAIETGTFNGAVGSYVIDLRTGKASINFLEAAPKNGSTAELPILSTQLCASGSPCLNATNPRFKYTVAAFDLVTGAADQTDGWAAYNAFSPAITEGTWDELDPGASASEAVTVNAAEWAQTPALGLMIVSLENKGGQDEAQLVKVDVK